MKNNFLIEIIEKTATVQERLNNELFEKDKIEIEAMQLWERYSSGETGEEISKRAMQKDNKNKELLEQEMSSVKLKCKVSDYIRITNNTWLSRLLRVLKLYDNKLCYDRIFESIFQNKNQTTLYWVMLPFFNSLRENLQDKICLADNVKKKIVKDFFNIIEPICNDTFLVATKRYYNEDDVIEKYYNSKDDEFIEWVYNGGIYDIVSSYPMCFKFAIKALETYEENIYLLDNRLQNDLNEISYELFNGIKLNSVTDISVALSDPHNGGKMVSKIVFDEKYKLIYKPRNVEIDVAWNKFISELNCKNEIFTFKFLKVIDKNEYGYVEYAEKIETENAKLYYKNAGQILCLVALFGGSDFHYENVIACGQFPVLVDLETIITPKPRRAYADFEKGKETNNAVTVGRTLLLPRWVGNSQTSSREIGGFTSISEYGRNYHINAGVKSSADQYIDDFINGYEETYKFILHNKACIREIINRCKFRDCRYRYVFRRTALYYNLYRHFLHAAFLKNSRMNEAVLMRIGAGILLTFDDETSNLLWNIVKSEKNSIYNGDIPYFFCDGDSNNISDIHQNLVADFFEKTPQNIVDDNLTKMSEKQMMHDIKYIKNSLILSKNQSQKETSTELLSYSNVNRKKKKGDNDAILQEIDRIYKLLKEYEIDDLKFEYYAPVRDRKTTRYNLDILEDTYYSGTWGVLLFQSAYAKLKGDKILQRDVLNKVNELTSIYLECNDKSIYLDLGLAQGIAGVLKSLVCIAENFGEESLYKVAEKIVLNVNEEFIIRCKETDFFGGLAGFIYICGLLYFRNKSPELYSLIRIATDEMLKRSSIHNNRIVWKTEMEYAPITGLAHGQSGYAVALAYAYKITKIKKYGDALNDVLSYESDSYNIENNNWLDYRKFNVDRRAQNADDIYTPRFMYGCCSGAPGIGMSRIMIGKLINDNRIDEDIERVKKFCYEQDIIGNDSYCCGSMGWIDFLIQLNSHENENEEIIKSIATSVIPEISGVDYLLSNLKEIYDIALFKGLSGIGYQLIRIILCGNIPSPIM